MTSDEYPYLAQLSVPDRLRLAAYEARVHGVPAVHLRIILDAAETLEGLIDWLEPVPRWRIPLRAVEPGFTSYQRS